MYTGNWMIDGDDGSDPMSPNRTDRYEPTYCVECGCEIWEGNTTQDPDRCSDCLILAEDEEDEDE